MKIDLRKFEEIVKKGTVGYSIDGLMVKFTKNTVQISMKGIDVISVIKVKNDILSLKKDDEVELCFIKPIENVLPYLDVIRNNSVDAVLSDKHLSITDSGYEVKLLLYHQESIKHLLFDNKKPNIDFNIDIQLNKELYDYIDRTKRINARLQNLYICCEKEKLFLQSGDEDTSKVKYNFSEYKGEDWVLKFGYRSFISLWGLLNDNFTLSFHYNSDRALGIMKASLPDDTETYYLLSKV